MRLAESYTQILEDLSPDWSDLMFDLVLPDESRLDEARLLMAPTQLERVPGERTSFTFRVAHTRGYGCFSDLAEACLRKLDDRMIGGYLSLDRVLYGVRENWTQGPA